MANKTVLYDREHSCLELVRYLRSQRIEELLLSVTHVAQPVHVTLAKS